MEWTNDPIGDAERYAAKVEERAAEFHCCEHCGRILNNGAYVINGDMLCARCVNDIFFVDSEEL